MQAVGTERVAQSDARNDELVQRMKGESKIFRLLIDECDRGWSDDALEEIWSHRKKRMEGKGGNRGPKKDQFDHIYSYYESYHEGLRDLKLESVDGVSKPVVLDYGAAPGGAVKFWNVDMASQVVGITLPWDSVNKGMRMLWQPSADFKLIQADLVTSSVESLVSSVRHELSVMAPSCNMMCDVVHHGAIIHRGQRNELQDATDDYALRLDGNVFASGFRFLRKGGHLLLVINPIYSHMCLLSVLLPLFEDFHVHRTGFRSSSKFRILLKNCKRACDFSNMPKFDNIEASEASAEPKLIKNAGGSETEEWTIEEVCDFLSKAAELGVDMWTAHKYFSVDRAFETFKKVVVRVDELWLDQLRYLMYLRLRAHEAVKHREETGKEDLMDNVASLIRGGEGGKIVDRPLNELFESLKVDDQGFLTEESDLIDRYYRSLEATKAFLQKEEEEAAAKQAAKQGSNQRGPYRNERQQNDDGNRRRYNNDRVNPRDYSSPPVDGYAKRYYSRDESRSGPSRGRDRSLSGERNGDRRSALSNGRNRSERSRSRSNDRDHPRNDSGRYRMEDNSYRGGRDGGDRYRDGPSFRDGPSNDRYRDGPSNDRYRDGPSNDRYRDGPSNDRYRDGPSNDRYRDGPSNDRNRDGGDRGGYSRGPDSFEGRRFNDGFPGGGVPRERSPRESGRRDGFRGDRGYGGGDNRGPYRGSRD